MLGWLVWLSVKINVYSPNKDWDGRSRLEKEKVLPGLLLVILNSHFLINNTEYQYSNNCCNDLDLQQTAEQHWHMGALVIQVLPKEKRKLSDYLV